MTNDAGNSTSTSNGNGDGNGRRAHRAGLFDIRIFIGGLLGVYGVILTIVGLVDTDQAELNKTDDFNINLVAGLVMVATCVFFVAWARLRPVVVPAHRYDSDEERRINEGG